MVAAHRLPSFASYNIATDRGWLQPLTENQRWHGVRSVLSLTAWDDPVESAVCRRPRLSRPSAGDADAGALPIFELGHSRAYGDDSPDNLKLATASV